MLCQFKTKSGLTIAKEALIADQFFSRLKGLMFSDDIKPHDALLITSCNSIHTCFMKYTIDVIFLSKDLRVVKILRNLKPWRMTLPRFGAKQVLEMKGGSLSHEVKVGDQLDRICIN